MVPPTLRKTLKTEVCEEAIATLEAITQRAGTEEKVRGVIKINNANTDRALRRIPISIQNALLISWEVELFCKELQHNKQVFPLSREWQ